MCTANALLLVKICTVAIVGYCDTNPNATVTNSLVVGSFATTFASTATVGCAIGYRGSGLSSTATCTAYNLTDGYWGGLSYSCTRMPSAVSMNSYSYYCLCIRK